MILAENAVYLKKQHPMLWSSLKLSENQWKSDTIIPIVTKSGLPSLLIEEQDKQIYLHSKYDPLKEAGQWIHTYEEQLKHFNHIFFYGIGFAYHIEYLMRKYPDKQFTLYEPNPYIFYAYLCQRNLSDLPLNHLKHLCVVDGSVKIEDILSNLLTKFTEEFLIIPHPVYERAFEQATKHFLNVFKESLYTRRASLLFISETQHLWTLNAVQNFLKVLKTPNILREKKDFLKGKPVILVSAGPSLEEDIENIRSIKERGLAYIFAVGSSNKALLNHGIVPDAMTTFDPYDHNILVFEKIITENITNIPLIFGTSVGYRTVAYYPGPMLHMFTNKDFISNYYLKTEKIAENNEVIPDASTIAIITLDLVHRLGCETVILAGQNFAFKDNQYYSQGIKDHYHINNAPSATESKDMEFVESVDGNQIASMKAFSMGRWEMEKLIRESEGLKVINTTKGGAKIEGAPFMELSQVISEMLQEHIVDTNWFKAEKTHYNKENLHKQAIEIQKDYEHLAVLFAEIKNLLYRLSKLSKYKKMDQINKVNKQLASKMESLASNKFYLTFIKVELTHQTDSLNIALDEVRNLDIGDMIMSVVLDKYNWYLNEIEQVYLKRKDLFLQFQTVLFEQIG